MTSGDLGFSLTVTRLYWTAAALVGRRERGQVRWESDSLNRDQLRGGDDDPGGVFDWATASRSGTGPRRWLGRPQLCWSSGPVGGAQSRGRRSSGWGRHADRRGPRHDGRPGRSGLAQRVSRRGGWPRRCHSRRRGSTLSSRCRERLRVLDPLQAESVTHAAGSADGRRAAAAKASASWIVKAAHGPSSWVLRVSASGPRSAPRPGPRSVIGVGSAHEAGGRPAVVGTPWVVDRGSSRQPTKPATATARRSPDARIGAAVVPCALGRGASAPRDRADSRSDCSYGPIRRPVESRSSSERAPHPRSLCTTTHAAIVGVDLWRVHFQLPDIGRNAPHSCRRSRLARLVGCYGRVRWPSRARWTIGRFALGLEMDLVAGLGRCRGSSRLSRARVPSARAASVTQRRSVGPRRGSRTGRSLVRCRS